MIFDNYNKIRKCTKPATIKKGSAPWSVESRLWVYPS
jgi:hypothetical protein